MKIYPNTKFQYTKNCREINGFGDSYEEACRTMVIAGMEWFDNNPELKKIKWTDIPPENKKELEQVICDAIDGPSGAMYGAALNHIIFAYTNGWIKYIQEMEKKDE